MGPPSGLLPAPPAPSPGTAPAAPNTWPAAAADFPPVGEVRAPCLPDTRAATPSDAEPGMGGAAGFCFLFGAAGAVAGAGAGLPAAEEVGVAAVLAAEGAAKEGAGETRVAAALAAEGAADGGEEGGEEGGTGAGGKGLGAVCGPGWAGLIMGGGSSRERLAEGLASGTFAAPAAALPLPASLPAADFLLLPDPLLSSASLPPSTFLLLPDPLLPPAALPPAAFLLLLDSLLPAAASLPFAPPLTPAASPLTPPPGVAPPNVLDLLAKVGSYSSPLLIS